VYEVGTALDLDTALFAHPASDANPGRAYSISAPVGAQVPPDVVLLDRRSQSKELRGRGGFDGRASTRYH